jgi:hypothetical protein
MDIDFRYRENDMPQRFHTTSTNRIIALSAQPNLAEFQFLLQANRQLQDLIMRFNLGVEGAFPAGSMHGMAACCTAGGLERMQGKYANWTDHGIITLKLVSCDFLSFDLMEDGQRAAVYTYEKWVFIYADGRQEATSGSVNGYDVHRVDGTWRVDSVTFYAPNLQPG